MTSKLYYILGFLLVVFASTLNAQNNNYQVTILNDHDEVDLTGIKYCTIYDEGIFAMVGHTLISMDEERIKTVEEFALPDSTIVIDETVFLPELFVCKADSHIYYLNKRNHLRGFTIDTDDFSIRYASDSTIFILVDDKVFETNPRKGKPVLRFRYNERKIIDYLPLANGDVYVVTETELLIKNSNKGLVSLLTMPETITAVNISSHGIFIGTSTRLFKYNSINTLQLVDEIPISQILNDGEYLYIVSTDSSIFRLYRLPDESSLL